MTSDMRFGAMGAYAVLHVTTDEVIGPMLHLRCEAIRPPRKPRRPAVLRWLLHPFIGQVSSPCRHRADGTMCEECAWRWAIR